MFLTATNVFHYLRDVGLADAGDIVDDAFCVREIGRRNRNFHIIRTPGRSLFVKQVPAVIAETSLSFAREAACAQLAAQDPACASLRAVMPTLRRYDNRRHVLVYDAIDDGASLTEWIARHGEVGEAVTDALAATLAAVHVETRASGTIATLAPVLSGEPPWIFIIGEQAETVMPNMSGGVREIVAQLRATPELLVGLSQLGKQWPQRCLTHGDLKFDNVMVVERGDERALRLIDWELGNLGDPLWDVAGAIGAYFQLWLLRQPAQALQAGGALAARQEVQRDARRFWAIYRGASGSFGDEAETLRLGYLCGARLALLAFELLANAPAMTPHAQAALHCARYCFADTRAALRDLFGLHSGVAGGESVPVQLPSRERSPWTLAPAARVAA
jgi:hypothetical protein